MLAGTIRMDKEELVMVFPKLDNAVWRIFLQETETIRTRTEVVVPVHLEEKVVGSFVGIVKPTYQEVTSKGILIARTLVSL